MGRSAFKIDNWSLLQQVETHFLVTFFGFTPLAILAGWFPLRWDWLISYTITFIIVYLVVWFLKMSILKSQVEKVNQKLK
ncbi:DUF3021 domain-containing protein [Lactobacillus sp. DCY120]|uniref:DUF3021 domain-containing protein n=1 Tax=Bombilactobacillus apium TaxID=2675299 RepID=A0A850RDA0_9LACO|nr:DUF3021 domain-containing protein [Bombilactobacillus apium]